MKFELEERTKRFAKKVIAFCRKQPTDIVTRELVRQLVRSAGSVGANYVEANEGMSKKDFLKHLRIARKEARETKFWLELIADDSREDHTLTELTKESEELLKILTAIIKKSE